MKCNDKINITNKRVLIRVDFNVPIKKNKILSDFRIKSAKETILYCLKKNASIILMSHLGRPKGNESKYSLLILKDYLEKYFKTKVYFSNDCISDEAINQSINLKPREIHLLENLRYYKEENDNEEMFAYKLSNHADIYVYDAFGTSHRKHASNSKILKYFKNKCIGFLFDREVKCFENFFSSKYKGVVVIGGAKISTKIQMLENFMRNSTHILIGGAMAFTFLKAKGVNVGKSLFENEMLDKALDILRLAEQNNVQIILPVDVVCANEYSPDTDIRICGINDMNNDDMGLDIGPETTMIFEMILEDSEIVIWNGPLGAFELPPFSTGTHSIAYCISKITKNRNVISIIGGGDTASSVISCNLDESYTHVSTGGGASLEILSGKELKFFLSWRKYE